MSRDKTPRVLQQQPARETYPQQQQSSGRNGFQQAGGQAQGQVEGEGSYSASRDYQKNIRNYLDKADVQADAENAKPRSEDEAREIEAAEREGRSHSKGER